MCMRLLIPLIMDHKQENGMNEYIDYNHSHRRTFHLVSSYADPTKNHTPFSPVVVEVPNTS